MARPDSYPWELLTETGDYFMVPQTVKKFSYMKSLVAVRNSRMKGIHKYAALQLDDGDCIVFYVQALSQKPPYEFLDANGNMCSTSKEQVHRALKPGMAELGMRPIVPPKTIPQLVAMMTPEERVENLPWWHEPRNGKLVFNPKIATKTDMEKWVSGKFNPSPDWPYPDYYRLDENLRRMPEPEEDEDQWAGMSADGDNDAEE